LGEEEEEEEAAAAGSTCSRHNKYTVWISFFWNTALRQWVIGFRRVEAAECDSTMAKSAMTPQRKCENNNNRLHHHHHSRTRHEDVNFTLN
jgi:hypothetical protein